MMVSKNDSILVMEYVYKIAKALQHLTSLRSLNLGSNNIPKESCGELVLAIKSNIHLEELWLHGNNLRSSSVTILQSLSTLSTLKLLNINNNHKQ